MLLLTLPKLTVLGFIGIEPGMAIGTRMGTFFLPFNLFAELFALFAPFLPDWKVHNKNR